MQHREVQPGRDVESVDKVSNVVDAAVAVHGLAVTSMDESDNKLTYYINKHTFYNK